MSVLLGDLHEIETFDGLIETFGAESQAIQVYGGYGAPPINFSTAPNLNRVGLIERNYNLLARPMVLDLWVRHAESLDAYWDARGRLHNLLRPNRGGAMTLTIQLPNMARRSIDVWANPGLRFMSEPNNSWLITEPLELLAHDPIWYDNADISVSNVDVILPDLRFPITFPIRFGYSYVSATTGAFVYDGTWETWPIITLNGPYSSAQVGNVVTGATIYLITPIGPGEQRIIDLTPGAITVTDANGVLKFEDVDPISNFVQFQIKPVPEAPGGVNEITAIMFNSVVGTSNLTITYKNRYFGV